MIRPYRVQFRAAGKIILVLVKIRVGKIPPFKVNFMKTKLTHRPSVLAARRWCDVLDIGSLRGMSLGQWM